MESTIYGRKAKLYALGEAPTPITVENIISAFPNADLIREISIGFPRKDGSGSSLGQQNYLYINGEFQEQTANLFDEYASQWQLAPIIITKHGLYNGNCESSSILFPNKYENLRTSGATRTPYDLMYVTDDDLQYCQAMYFGPNYPPTSFVFHKQTLAQLGSDYYFIDWVVMGNATFTSRLWSVQCIFNTTGTSGAYKGSNGYNTTSQNSTWWMQRESSFNLPETTGFTEGYVPIREDSDPFEPGGTAETGGGTGDFDGTSVPVDFAIMPNISAGDTGFISIYRPGGVDLKDLATFMWSNLFDANTFKKLFGNPMEAILGLSIVPGEIPASSTAEVILGNVRTGVTMPKVDTQYIDVNCGRLNVKEFWGAYLDYEPYTKAEIYLPYIGTHQIAVDDIMNKEVHIKYHIDILSGACAAEIKCQDSVLYTFTGAVSTSIPITGKDWTNVINGALSIAGSIGSMVASGGKTAPMAIGEIASSATNLIKPSVEKSGSAAGPAGILGGQVPVLILTRPRQARPMNQNSFTGYPAFITRRLENLTGYTEIYKVINNKVIATDTEIDEIEELLKGGVIL